MSNEEVDVAVSYLRNVVSGLKTDPEPIDLAHVTRWSCWTYGGFKCLYCEERCDVGYEVRFQWGDTNRWTYVKEMCSQCLSRVCKASRNAKESKYVLK